MIQFLLLITSIILFIIFGTIGFIFQCVDNFLHINKYLLKVAISIDQLGNVTCNGLFNHLLRKRGGHEFGNPDETISAVLGINKGTNTLTFLGLWVANLLNKIEKDHVEKAAENDN